MAEFTKGPKWTPGPWSITHPPSRTNDAKTGARYIKGPIVKQGTVVRTICTVHGHTENDALIASAPELALAVEHLLEVCVAADVTGEAIDAARTLLRRVEGGAS